jgi:hypothetical protein
MSQVCGNSQQKKHGFELGGVKDIRGKGFIICGNSPWLKSPLMEIDST